MLDNKDAEGKSRCNFHGETRLESRLLRSGTQHTCRQAFIVTRNTLALDNDDGTVKRAECGLEQSSDAPTYFEFAESLGGSESRNFWRPVFNLIGLPEEEDE
jgi:hypothetical protein